MQTETQEIKKKRGRPNKNKIILSKVITVPNDNNVKSSKLDKAASLMQMAGGKFDTLDLDTYKARLDNFSLNELNNEAFRIGLKGGADRSNTVRAILEIFNDYRRQITPDFSGTNRSDGLTAEKRATIANLMKDGRN